jgi:hypothetical protein
VPIDLFAGSVPAAPSLAASDAGAGSGAAANDVASVPFVPAVPEGPFLSSSLVATGQTDSVAPAAVVPVMHDSEPAGAALVHTAPTTVTSPAQTAPASDPFLLVLQHDTEGPAGLAGSPTGTLTGSALNNGILLSTALPGLIVAPGIKTGVFGATSESPCNVPVLPTPVPVAPMDEGTLDQKTEQNSLKAPGSTKPATAVPDDSADETKVQQAPPDDSADDGDEDDLVS